MVHLTRREKHVLLIILLIFPIFFFVDQQTINDWELVGLIFFVLPLGIYILTDQERLGKLLKRDVIPPEAKK